MASITACNCFMRANFSADDSSGLDCPYRPILSWSAVTSESGGGDNSSFVWRSLVKSPNVGGLPGPVGVVGFFTGELDFPGVTAPEGVYNVHLLNDGPTVACFGPNNCF
ncbi:hypothetical protein PG996_015879 [Apiospora saccharicola]|uniref:Uncharacterized protein n=1 Tax=Apiospora saccharicola TaxID=335842 RepID=A0ABR1TMD8_9PEZI